MPTPISSSLIRSISTEGPDLLVTFTRGGRTYRYPGAATHHDALLAAPSAGRYFHENVRGLECSECKDGDEGRREG